MFAQITPGRGHTLLRYVSVAWSCSGLLHCVLLGKRGVARGQLVVEKHFETKIASARQRQDGERKVGEWWHSSLLLVLFFFTSQMGSDSHKVRLPGGSARNR